MVYVDYHIMIYMSDGSRVLRFLTGNIPGVPWNFGQRDRPLTVHGEPPYLYEIFLCGPQTIIQISDETYVKDFVLSTLPVIFISWMKCFQNILFIKLKIFRL